MRRLYGRAEATRAATMPMSPGVLSAIWARAKQCGWKSDDVYDVIKARFGKEHLGHLKLAEGYALLDAMGGRESYKGTDRGKDMARAGRKGETAGATRLVTMQQMGYIQQTAAIRGWDEAALDKFVQRQLGHPIRTLADYNRVLWGIKAMNRRDKGNIEA
jgi:hypothetical protein